MNILVLGQAGMLGRSVVRELLGNAPVSGLSREALDVTDELSVRRVIRAIKPTHIINCTAFRSVDGCEQNHVAATKANVHAVKYIVDSAKDVSAKVIHFSTDYVFDGAKNAPYIEEDAVCPLQAYGLSKLTGERIALEAGHTVFRVQWLYGDGKENFIDWVAGSVLSYKSIPIASFQEGCPTSTVFVAKIVSMAIKSGLESGLYHLAHDDYTNRWDCAAFIATYFSVNPYLVFEKTDKNFGIAKRPGSTVLNSERLRNALGVRSLGDWQSDLSDYLRSKYAK